MSKIVSQEEFKNKYTIIENTNGYVTEITTGKTYVAIFLDDTHEIQLMEPKQYEENMEKIKKQLENKFKEIL